MILHATLNNKLVLVNILSLYTISSHNLYSFKIHLLTNILTIDTICLHYMH